MKDAVNTIVIPVAGAGTRLRPITYVTPKELLRLVDKPIIYYLIKEAYEAGIHNVIFITHVERKDLRNFLKSKGARELLKEFSNINLRFLETDQRLGDGQCLFEARNILKREKAFAVTMGDLISFPGTSLIGELKNIYLKNKIPVISVEKIDRSKSRQYGIIDPEKSDGRIHFLKSIIEKPEPKEAPSEYAMTGKYILTPKIFGYLGKLLKERGPNEEVKLANALRDYAKDYKLCAYTCKNRHFDTGNKADLIKTELIFALRHPELRKRLRLVFKDILKKN
ncbi:MAG: sugar phosphate nucleotidyltransferase [Patescibacteria group bacterium]